ncbi:MAG: hypothetical protein Q8N60_04855, partial [Candidatus Diapherotrites archaeon]|nr:hypothetical protein [Candidatus Diapherotrites archaeon]
MVGILWLFHFYLLAAFFITSHKPKRTNEVPPIKEIVIVSFRKTIAKKVPETGIKSLKIDEFIGPNSLRLRKKTAQHTPVIII